MDKDNKGHRKLEESGKGLLHAVKGHSVEQNRTDINRELCVYMSVCKCACTLVFLNHRHTVECKDFAIWFSTCVHDRLSTCMGCCECTTVEARVLP